MNPPLGTHPTTWPPLPAPAAAKGTCTRGTVCAGHTHHEIFDGHTDCPGGGRHELAGKQHRGTTQGRVDDNPDSCRGAALAGARAAPGGPPPLPCSACWV